MVDEVVFIRLGDGYFKISAEALETMLQLIQDKQQKTEVGGILLGRHIFDTNNIIVDQITVPMQGDICTQYRFFRARKRHQQIVDRVWKTSGGTCTYLGEWHTHPELVPRPSSQDKHNWRRKLMIDKFSNYLFFAIVGTSDLRVWEGHRHHTRLYPLRQRN